VVIACRMVSSQVRSPPAPAPDKGARQGRMTDGGEEQVVRMRRREIRVMAMKTSRTAGLLPILIPRIDTAHVHPPIMSER